MPHYTTIMSSFSPANIGFVGLGAMGFGMASHLVKSGYNVRGFDVIPSQVAAFEKLGGHIANSPREAAADSKVLIVVVASCAQADSVFFNPENGAVLSLPRDATIVLCATVPPSYYGLLEQHLNSLGRQDISLLDAPISGGAVKASLGKLTILTAGSETARKTDAGVVAMMAEKVYHIPGALGAASTVKMINQLLAGVHIAAAAECMALAARMHLNTQKAFDAVNASLSWSWMFENRAEHMLRDDWTPKSALDIFVKDMVSLDSFN
jgi:3-hydroxyisobutyrate dehydrogenase-like beta-hydroxyacid dehydrogenase